MFSNPTADELTSSSSKLLHIARRYESRETFGGLTKRGGLAN
jgi:hypothetical protein